MRRQCLIAVRGLSTSPSLWVDKVLTFWQFEAFNWPQHRTIKKQQLKEMMMMMLVGSSKRRKLQIVVKISVNFGNVFRCCGCGCYFATLWWPFAVASATVVVVRFVVSAFCQRGKTENLLKHGNTRQRDRERERKQRKRSKTARRVERKLCDFRVRKVCSVSFPPSSHLSPSFCLLPHSTRIFSLLIFDIFLGQHFQRVYFHVKNTFSRFRFISYFSFLRPLSDFILLACFLWARHALAWNWQLRRHQAKF